MNRRLAGSSLLAALVMVMAGCSPLKLIDASVSAEQFTVATGIAYGPHPRQRLDVYTPDDAMGGPAPIVIFFYGGRWQSGSRSDYRFVAEALTQAGFVTVIPDHTLYPEVRYPAFVEDGARAVRWVREHIQAFGGDPQAIYLAGHSSGAYIAAMLNLNRSFLDSTGLRGAIGLAGPYDFLPLTSSDLTDIFGATPDLTKTQPISHVDGDEPPMLLITGRGDRIVDPGNTSRLASRIREQGGSVDERLYAFTGHGMLVASIAGPLRGFAPTLSDMIAFISSTSPAGTAGQRASSHQGGHELSTFDTTGSDCRENPGRTPSVEASQQGTQASWVVPTVVDMIGGGIEWGSSTPAPIIR